MAKVIAGILTLFVAAFAAAAPVTLNVTPTFSPPSGIVDGYRLYRDCDGTPVLVGTVTSGVPISFSHDPANGDPHVVTRAFNSEGESVGGNCTTLALQLAPPGDVTTTYTCELSPVSGGTCTAQ